MTSKATTVAEYLDNIDPAKRETVSRLRNTILEHIPDGFREEMNYGMIGYVVPHSLYPGGYHCDPKLPLPFMNVAAQKNFVAVYHMGIYANQELMDWFLQEYPKHSKAKLDMGKSCIRFKKPEDIPFELIGQLAEKMSVEDWVNTYETAFRSPKK